jgi:hypothetical protein
MEKPEKDAIKDSLGEIDRWIENARQAVQQIEHAELNQRRAEMEEGKEMLEFYLAKSQQLVAMALEIGGLHETRTELLHEWRDFVDKKSLTVTETTRYDAEWSRPLEYLETVVQGMKGAIGEGISSAEGFELAKFEAILKKTAYVVRHQRSITPQSEKDIRDVMHDYLSVFFPGYTTKLTIAKPIKTFIPDGGVPSLKAAIEFKFATSEKEVKQALDGIYADMIGYGGSQDWKRFYTVVYQTDEFVAEDAFREAILPGGRGTWTPILRTAPGGRKIKKKKKTLKAPLKKPKKPARKTSKKGP